MTARWPVYGDNVVATSQPLAAQAGLTMLQRGGNAVDAAVAAAAALTVVEPTSNGIGGDAFAIVAHGTQVHGLNASGRSPARLDPERFLGKGPMPLRGWDAVTVPGAVSAWVALAERFGTLPLDELLAPAIRWASEGWPVGPVTAAAWGRAPGAYADQPDFAAAFLPGGRAPRAGERFALPDQARTLRRIAATSGEAFYRGELAAALAAHAAAAGAPLTADDLAAHRPRWVDTLRLEHQLGTVHELPPNGQGIAALLALGILAATPGADGDPDSAEGIHWQVEAMKLAFADAHAHVADPAVMRLDPSDLLAEKYLRQRAGMIDPKRAGDPGHGTARAGGTVYLATADADGNCVSYIQSNYHGFGSGVVVPGTGIALQNRGAGFSTEAGHPNAVAAGKLPFHTIIPALVTGPEGPRLAFGVMGGPMQPQGHLQVLARIAAGANPQAASDAPRWRVSSGRRLALEEGIDPDVRAELERRGHEPSPENGMAGFGGAQLIARAESAWLGASDHRKEGAAVAW